MRSVIHSNNYLLPRNKNTHTEQSIECKNKVGGRKTFLFFSILGNKSFGWPPNPIILEDRKSFFPSTLVHIERSLMQKHGWEKRANAAKIFKPSVFLLLARCLQKQERKGKNRTELTQLVYICCIYFQTHCRQKYNKNPFYLSFHFDFLFSLFPRN